jgi:hypothetical protein
MAYRENGNFEVVSYHGCMDFGYNGEGRGTLSYAFTYAVL